MIDTIAITIPAPVTVGAKAAIVAAIAGRTGRPFEVLISTGSTVEIATTMRRVGPKTIAKWEAAVRLALRGNCPCATCAAPLASERMH